MSQGLRFAQLVALVGKPNGARWGTRRVTISAVGWRDGERFVMGTLACGGVVLGNPDDFTVPEKRKPRVNIRENGTLSPQNPPSGHHR